VIVVDASVLANALADDHADGDAARGELRADVSAYDACYVALAERLDCELLTADGRQNRSSETHSLVIMQVGKVAREHLRIPGSWVRAPPAPPVLTCGFVLPDGTAGGLPGPEQVRKRRAAADSAAVGCMIRAWTRGPTSSSGWLRAWRWTPHLSRTSSISRCPPRRVALEDALDAFICHRTGCRHRRVASAGDEVLRAFGISAAIEEVRDTA
jgi:hypothetical protein